MSFTLEDLATIIHDRASAAAGASYTRSLLDKGPAVVARKLGEEAVELVIAAVETPVGPYDRSRAIVGESADVLYHLLVLLESTGVAFSDVLTELQRRTMQSGHEEKAARAR